MCLVVLVLFLFLQSLRGALIVAITIPAVAAHRVHPHALHRHPGELAVAGRSRLRHHRRWRDRRAFENIMRHSRGAPARDASRRARPARRRCRSRRPMFFAMVIIITAYIPLFAFQRRRRSCSRPWRMYRWLRASRARRFRGARAHPGPVARDVPAKPRPVRRNLPLEWLTRSRATRRRSRRGAAQPREAGRPAGRCSPRWPPSCWSLVVGKEFLPELDEELDLAAGAAAARPVRSSTRAAWPTSCGPRRASSPRSRRSCTQLGRNDDGTDPWTPSHIECSVGLHDYDTLAQRRDEESSSSRSCRSATSASPAWRWASRSP